MTRRQQGVLMLLLAAAGCYYLGTVLTSRNRNRFSREARGYHQMQAEAFLAGRLSLPVEPAPELLALPDPYDPAASAPYRRHDLSLYRGKYYMYWGPAPALLWFAPFRALTGFHFSENIAAALFAWGAAALSCALLVRWRGQYLPATPFWMTASGAAALCVCNTAPWMLRRTEAYEVPITAAALLTTAALYCLAGGGPLANLPPWRLAWGGTLVALAVATRMSALGATVMLAAVAWRGRHAPRAALRAALLFAPLAVCLGLLGLYNKLRFDSWIESGLHYQLAMFPIRHFDLFSPARIPLALYHFFWAPSAWTPEFPFLLVRSSAAPWEGPRSFFYEPVAGLLRTVPILNLLWLAGWVRRLPDVWWILLMTVGTALAEALVVGAAFGVAMRYEMDFAGLLLLGALVVWFCLGPRRPVLGLLGVPLLLYGMAVHAAFGLVGWDDSLHVVSPSLWRALRHPFAPLERALAPRAAGRYGPRRLRLEFSSAPHGPCEPLLTTGTISAADLAMVRYVEPASVVLGFEHLGGSAVWSTPVPVEPGRTYELQIAMGSLYPASDAAFERLYPGRERRALRRRFRLRLDGREILSGASDFHESRLEQVQVGRNYAAPQRCGAAFSGRLLEVLYDRFDDQ